MPTLLKFHNSVYVLRQPDGLLPLRMESPSCSASARHWWSTMLLCLAGVLRLDFCKFSWIRTCFPERLSLIFISCQQLRWNRYTCRDHRLVHTSWVDTPHTCWDWWDVSQICLFPGYYFSFIGLWTNTFGIKGLRRRSTFASSKDMSLKWKCARMNSERNMRWLSLLNFRISKWSL